MESQRNILIVDDDAEFADMIAQAVSDVSDAYGVQVATNADEAMVEIRDAQASQRPFDLVITDIKMPGSSGLKLLEALKQVTPETKTITMTAYHSPDLAARVQELDVQAYLIKPIVLSEFHKIVRDVLTSPATTTVQGKAASELSSTQRAAVERQLANLRRMTGSIAALLIHINGTTLATDRLEAEIDTSDLCQVLMDAQRMMAQEMTRAFSRETVLQQSYYGTETYSICTYQLDDSHVAAAIFGPAVREGQVWYYMREAIDGLRKSLAGEAESLSTRRSERSGDVFDMLDRFFPDRPKRRSRTRRTASAEATVTAEQPPTMSVADAEPGQAQSAEAQQPGSSTPDTAEAHKVEAEASTEHSIDELEWDVPSDLDWDGLVADTDLGFSGMNFEEAKKRGLVDDLEVE